jgi:hypothetical protein
MNPVFFYGLFMDEALLRSKGFNPSCSGIARVEGFGLRIGERASLVKSENERAYGLMMFMSHEELKTLYGEESVSDYVPENLTVTTSNNKNRVVIAYNLPVEKLAGRNKEYADSLAILAKKVGLPSAYIEEIEKWAI